MAPARPLYRLEFLLVILAVVGIVAAIGVTHDRATSTQLSHGAASSPPWPAPTGDRQQKLSAAADLPNVYGAKLAEHVHTHLTITVDGVPQAVAAQIGLDESHGYATSLHTHDTSGIIHVESPERRDFTLGQFFTEWDVRLDARHIGSEGGDIGEILTVFVDGHRRAGDPSSIVLRNLDDIDLVIHAAGTRAQPAPAFDWPGNYR
ncbi:hypothetical protein EDF46_1105 [Frondihabitans sp. PhB188]|uniref:hypothetical protein n=1 Tax=Frondihabitans sp. PhB188 TaxID=2485200 RepID=UPI000FB14655|nr:hypothetical protein [Frondihabitans sp. PhB188]ROQ39473.1 hypothetical protein EDF46_1105 [Frondihabitans sp. PhB188]